MSQVIWLSTSTCSWRRRAKRYLKKNRVRFKEIDVGGDSEATRDLARKTGQTRVPVIEIGSNSIVGFDRLRIARELELAS